MKKILGLDLGTNSIGWAVVKAEVEKRLAGNAPRGNSGTGAEITKESAKKMSVAELAQLKRTNPELYNNLYN